MIPPYLTDATLWWSLLPIPGLAIAFAAGIYACLRKLRPAVDPVAVILPMAAFLVLGQVAGYLTGLSRESAVGAVVPAVLSLLGGIAAVLIGRAASPAAAVRVSSLILLFSLGLLIGTTWGAAMRQAVVDYESSENELIRRSHIELKVREFRDAVGLPPEMPTSETSAPKKKAKE